MESKQTAVEWLIDQVEDFIGLISVDIIEQAKEMEKQQLEKELNRFFLYFRDNGERLLGASIEQLVKSYMKSRVDEDKNI
jgi:hypothetical protein